MKLVLLFGPQAVGKMTVGEQLARLTGLKLFHNHMTIELVSHFFSYGTATGKRLVNLFRQAIFEEVAKSELEGLIFTYVWYFDSPEDRADVQKLHTLFASHGAQVYYVELEANLETRLTRNKTEHRLQEKPTKRDIAWSERELLDSAQRHRLNSLPGEIDDPHYLRIDNTKLSAGDAARMICRRFGFAMKEE